MGDRLKEKELTPILQKMIQRESSEFEVLVGENLICQVIINHFGKFEPNNPENPKRGQSAFQTDLLI